MRPVLSPPKEKAVASKKIRLTASRGRGHGNKQKSEDSPELGIKSMEEIFREKALATLGRGRAARAKEAAAGMARGEAKTEPPRKTVTLKSAAPPSTVSSSGDNLPIIKSLEEIRREQALASMKRVAEKAKQRQKKPLTKLAPHNSHTSGQDSDNSQLDDQTEEEEDEEEEVPITRRIIISDDSTKEEKQQTPNSSPKAQDKPVAVRLVRQVMVDRRGVKSRLGTVGGVKARLGRGSVKRMDAVGQLVEASSIKKRLGITRPAAPHKQESSSEEASLSPFSDDSEDDTLEEEKMDQLKQKVTKAVPNESVKEPVIIRKISFNPKKSVDVKRTSVKRTSVMCNATKPVVSRLTEAKKERKAPRMQIYKPPAMKGKAGTVVGHEEPASKERINSRKVGDWSSITYSDMIREKKVTMAGASSSRSHSPISFSDPPPATKVTVKQTISPISLVSETSEGKQLKRTITPIKFDIFGDESDTTSKDTESKIVSLKRKVEPVTVKSDKEPVISRPKRPKLVWSTRSGGSASETAAFTSRKLKLKTKTAASSEDTGSSASVLSAPLPPYVKSSEKTVAACSSALSLSKLPPAKKPPVSSVSVSEPVLASSHQLVTSPKVQAAPAVKSVALVARSRATLPERRASMTKAKTPSTASNKSLEKHASYLGDLGNEVDLLDDDLIDLFTDDTPMMTSEHVMTTQDEDDDLLAQMDEFLT